LDQKVIESGELCRIKNSSIYAEIASCSKVFSNLTVQKNSLEEVFTEIEAEQEI
jgi:hypothetical protein